MRSVESDSPCVPLDRYGITSPSALSNRVCYDDSEYGMNGMKVEWERQDFLCEPCKNVTIPVFITDEPSASPTEFPSLSPSDAPTEFPSRNPSDTPSASFLPSSSPSGIPSVSSIPSFNPSDIPSVSSIPSHSPSDPPSASTIPSASDSSSSTSDSGPNLDDGDTCNCPAGNIHAMSFKCGNKVLVCPNVDSVCSTQGSTSSDFYNLNAGECESMRGVEIGEKCISISRYNITEQGNGLSNRVCYPYADHPGFKMDGECKPCNEKKQVTRKQR